MEYLVSVAMGNDALFVKRRYYLMSDKEKLRRLIEQGHDYYYSDAYNGASVYEAIAEYLIMKGVRLKEGADNG